MRMIVFVPIAALLVIGSARADVGPYGLRGNDTGGIIPWTPATDLIYKELAGDHCARFFKGSQTTSVHRQIGDYVAFTCRFDRNYDPVKARNSIPATPPAPPVIIHRSVPAAPKPVIATPPGEK